MENSELNLIKNIKLISIYIFNKESSMSAISDIYTAINRFNLKTELIKITSISFSVAVKDDENTDAFINSLTGYSEVRIRKNLALVHIKNSSLSSEMLSNMFTRLNEEELRMVHYRFDSNHVTLISDEHRLDDICRKITRKG
jgi:aspartokinase